MGKLFGTDGVRGIAGEQLSCELALLLGKATAQILTQEKEVMPLVLVGRDTRLSGDMLCAAFSAGLCEAGANVLDLGIISTPAVAYLVKKYNASAGAMISASHNPWQFNGIKLFDKNGFKLADELEEQIEQLVLSKQGFVCASKQGRMISSATALNDYIQHLCSCASCTLNGMKIAVDCANGAAAVSAKLVLEQLGAQPVLLGSEPNGTNINLNCGSTFLQPLKEYVQSHSDICAGVAFDGDADRCLFVDENGNEIDGDFIMAICGLHLHKSGTLTNNTIVGTVLTNLGFQKFCEQNGIRFESTKVGDRYVLEKMEQNGFCLGGEQSGHIIFRRFSTTGDGQLTAIQVLCLMQQNKQPLSKLASVMTKTPQVMKNIPVSEQKKSTLFENPAICRCIEQAEKQLGTSGRILVRLSGTEPLVRVMAEGESLVQIESLAAEIAAVIHTQLQ